MRQFINPIRAYSLGHFIICLLAVGGAAVLAEKLKRKEKTRVLFTLGIVLVILETIKQWVLIRGESTYSWSDLPLQLCSMPMYLCLAYPAAGKRRRNIENFLQSFGILGAAAAFIVPYDVLAENALLAAQSTLWHTLLLFLGLFCVKRFEREEKIRRKDLATNAAMYLMLAVCAICVNALFSYISKGTVNMFFLGPNMPCAAILDTLYLRYGWIAESAFMIFTSEVAGALILLASRAIYEKKEKIS